MKLKELEKRLKHEPHNLGLRVTVAGLLREAGRVGEAVELYRSVALAYRAQGRPLQASAVCRSILEIAPGDAACRALLAELTPPAVPEAPPLPAAPAPPAGPRPRPPTPAAAPPPRPPPAPARPSPAEPARRSSFDVTPLPRPVPYHLVDATSSATRIELDDPTRPGGERTEPGERRRSDTGGLAEAARRISGLIKHELTPSGEVDITAELETRQRPRIDPGELAKIAGPPPTAPTPRLEPDTDDELTQPRDLLPQLDDDE